MHVIFVCDHIILNNLPKKFIHNMRTSVVLIFYIVHCFYLLLILLTLCGICYKNSSKYCRGERGRREKH
jgi:hypothetical protein